jgi:hypothetical protein
MRRRWEACSGTRATAPAPGRALRDHSGQARTRRCVGRPKRAHAPLQPRRPSPHTSPHATRVWVPPRPHWIVRLGLRLDGHGGVPQAVEIGLTLPCTVEGSDRHRPENVQYGFSHRDAGRALLRAESSAVANVTATRPQCTDEILRRSVEGPGRIILGSLLPVQHGPCSQGHTARHTRTVVIWLRFRPVGTAE